MSSRLVAFSVLFLTAVVPQARAKEHRTLAFLRLVTDGRYAADRATLEDTFLDALSTSGFFTKVTGQSDVAALLGFDRWRQLTGCTDSTCLAEIAGALGVDYVAQADVGRLGKVTLVNLKIIAVKKVMVVARALRKVTDESDLPDAINSMSEEVAESMQGRAPPGRTVNAASPATAAKTAAPVIDPRERAQEAYEKKAVHVIPNITEGWTVRQGGRALPAGPEFYLAVGHPEMANHYRQVVASNRAKAWACGVVGAIGLGIGTYVAVANARSKEAGNGMVGLGVGIAILGPAAGLIAYGLAAGDPEPGGILGARKLADTYNAQLRRRLGLELDPGDAGKRSDAGSRALRWSLALAPTVGGGVVGVRGSF